MISGSQVIYIGKAKSLYHRWRTYLSGQDERAFVTFLNKELTDLEIILTTTDKEAILLENQLIKEHQPRYNVKLRDDKAYLFVRISQKHVYPRLELSRQRTKGPFRYFGPYASAGAIRKTLSVINRHFQLRTCSDTVLQSRQRPCLEYQIKRCPAPCVFEIHEQYNENIEHVTEFLGGRSQHLLEKLKHKMQAYSKLQHYEQAARTRDQIRAIEQNLQKQSIIDTKNTSRDVVGVFRQGGRLEVHISRIRQGASLSPDRFSFKSWEQPTDILLEDFMTRYYLEGAGSHELPQEILLPITSQLTDGLSLILKDRAQRKVKIWTPQKGQKVKMVKLACQNAQSSFHQKEHAQKN